MGCRLVEPGRRGFPALQGESAGQGTVVGNEPAATWYALCAVVVHLTFLRKRCMRASRSNNPRKAA